MVQESHMKSEEPTFQQTTKQLSSVWNGPVFISYLHKTDEWRVSNTTDEGLPTGIKSITVREETLEKALNTAIKEYESDNE